jgi:hypothetical protein
VQRDQCRRLYFITQSNLQNKAGRCRDPKRAKFDARANIYGRFLPFHSAEDTFLSNRRRFLETAAANAAALAVAPVAAFASIPRDIAALASPMSDDWDTAWTDRVKGRHKGVFDCAEPESGYGVLRAKAWARQTTEVLKAAPSDVSTVIVLRHNAIVLAMKQSFWDKYGIGAAKKVTHPLTQEPTSANPVLLGEKDGMPAQMAAGALPAQIAAGAIVLACNMALQDCIDTIQQKDKVSAEEARKRAIAYLVSGVILQPSGVFAAVRAQEAGALYVKSS